MTAERRFPVLGHPAVDGPLPASVPWALVEPHRERARTNHGQTLERLAERGGLCPVELWMLVHERGWTAADLGLSPSPAQVTREEAAAWLRNVASEKEWCCEQVSYFVDYHDGTTAIVKPRSIEQISAGEPSEEMDCCPRCGRRGTGSP